MSQQHTHNTQKSSGLRADQSGVASFLVTMVLMIVISLIVIGFAQISRRDQREALDDQLSSQAFYAAETGVNLVQNLMKTASTTNDLLKTNCLSTAPGTPAGYTGAQLTDTATQVVNTCLLVNPAPSSLAYDDVGVNSTVVPLNPTPTTSQSPYGTGTLTISWKPKTNQSVNVASCPTYGNIDRFTPSGSWPTSCPFGVLRFDLVDAGTSGLTEAGLENATVTVFAPPTGSGTPLTKYEGNGIGATMGPVQCTSGLTANCTLVISNMNYGGGNSYYMRLTSLYDDVSVTGISGKSTGNDEDVHFVGAQIQVDSTGKAVDVLRRISVRLDQFNQLAPSYAIQSTSGICKRYSSTGPGSFDLNGCTQ